MTRYLAIVGAVLGTLWIVGFAGGRGVFGLALQARVGGSALLRKLLLMPEPDFSSVGVAGAPILLPAMPSPAYQQAAMQQTGGPAPSQFSNVPGVHTSRGLLGVLRARMDAARLQYAATGTVPDGVQLTQPSV